jgi:regulator of Ty1 transposition protein 109
MATSLRDFVASELGKLPGSRTLTLHVLVSSPQRELELFSYAQVPRNNKITSQNILLLVSETIASDSPDSTRATNASRILVAALEATLYLFPGTSSSILYIGKIDTTGFSTSVPSPARTLARATIDFYARPDTRPAECGQRVWVHLFARAQSQYLFPDSAEWKAKRVLGDAGLVRWWWSLLGDVARDVSSIKKSELGTYL